MARRLMDLTRRLARASRLAPGAVDRVEAAWTARLGADPSARFLISAGPRHLLLDPAGAAALGAALDGDALPPADLRGAFSPWRTERQRRADSLARKLAVAQAEDLSALLAAEGGPWTYLNFAQAQLSADRLAALRAGGVACAVAMAHDLIALDHPELAPPQAGTRLLGFLAAAELCDGLVHASARTAEAAARHLERDVPSVTAPPGLTPLPRTPPDPETAEAPGGAFVLLGAIEPRRNQLGMLWLWRRLWDELAEAAPRLILIGRRAPGSEAAQDWLERAPMAGRLIFERRDLDDAALAAHLRGARALLAPSFAEAHGLPVAEALAVGCPVICADLPAFRAVGGGVPDYLDPLDLPAWIEAILAYAHPHPGGPDPRAAQLARLAAWRAPDWDAHFAAVDGLVARLGG